MLFTMNRADIQQITYCYFSPISCHLVCPWLWNVSVALNLLSAVLQALFLSTDKYFQSCFTFLNFLVLC